MAVSLKVNMANMARQFRHLHRVLKSQRIQRKGAKAQGRKGETSESDWPSSLYPLRLCAFAPLR